MKKGDIVAITVPMDWANAVVPATPLHYLKADDTATSRLFVAKLVSITDSEGLWVESLQDDPKTKKAKAAIDPGKILVPWKHILSIQSSPLLQKTRTAVGFANLEKLPT